MSEGHLNAVCASPKNLQQIGIHEHVARIHPGFYTHAWEFIDEVSVHFVDDVDDTWDIVMSLPPVGTHLLVPKVVDKLQPNVKKKICEHSYKVLQLDLLFGSHTPYFRQWTTSSYASVISRILYHFHLLLLNTMPVTWQIALLYAQTIWKEEGFTHTQELSLTKPTSRAAA